VAVPGAVAVYAQQAIVERTTEFAFSNPNLTVTAGQPVRITITNAGMFPHTIAFADEAGATITAQPDPNVAAGTSGVVAVSFTRAGTFDFWCPVDGHRDRGMVGKITVAGAQAAGGAGRAGGLDPLMTAGGLALLGVLTTGAGLLRRRASA
jgi:plastocyanin